MEGLRRFSQPPKRPMQSFGPLLLREAKCICGVRELRKVTASDFTYNDLPEQSPVTQSSCVSHDVELDPPLNSLPVWGFICSCMGLVSSSSQQ